VPAVSPKHPAVATTRRSFLARTAGLGALAGVVTLAAPAGLLVSEAGAQQAANLDDGDFGAFTIPLELAAIQVYQAALSYGALSGAVSQAVQSGQDHHQTVSDALTKSLLSADAAPPAPATAFSDPIIGKISTTLDRPTILRALADMEEVLSATHLQALSTIVDPITAKVVSQVLAIEAQQATYLKYQAGDTVDTLTPGAADTTRAISAGQIPGAPPAKSTSSKASSASGN
jgi:hypothetical protein